jgi:heat shock protein 5
MAKIATAYLGGPPKAAVIAVPARFNNAQRQATRDAARIANITVLHLMNEPTAACFAYGYHKNLTNMTILVYDFGGGTFDVSVMSVSNGNYTVLAIDGDSHLGGEDMERRIVDHLKKKVHKKLGIDVSQNIRAMAKLSHHAQKAKIVLSQVYETDVMIESISGDEDFEYRLTRAKFENLCSDLFARTMEPLAKVIEAAKLTKNDINEIVLVGGSTRIPKVIELVQDFFDGKQPARNINPAEVVAYGAALRAATLTGEEDLEDIIVVDVNPLTLGTDNVKGFMSVLIPANVQLPFNHTKSFKTAMDNQTHFHIGIYEGEFPMVKDNHLISQFVLEGIELGAAGKVRVDITFHLDEDGILTVSAKERGGSAQQEVRIAEDEMRLSDEEMAEAKKKFEEYRENEEQKEKAKKAKNELETFISRIKKKLADGTLKLSGDDKRQVERKVSGVLSWIQKNPTEVVDVYEEKLASLKEELTSIIENQDL